MKRLRNLCPRRFRREEDGAVTVEAALWLPFLIFIVVALGDLAFVFHAQARTLEIMEDGIRQYSIGAFATPAETSTWIEGAISQISPNAQATTAVNFGLINSQVLIPIGDINGFGIFSQLRNFNITVEAQQVMEFGG